MTVLKNKGYLLLNIFISFLAALIIIFFVNAVDQSSLDIIPIVKGIVSSKRTLASIVVLTAFFAVTCKSEAFWKLVFKYRFQISLIVFLLLVVFGINGSSAGNWRLYFGDTSTGNIFGKSRLVRTDEWALFTPMSLSQYFNPNGKFAYLNPLLRGVDTDYFLLYGQPVLHPAILFKPFFWGYLFLPANNGIAWYWSGRFIALLLTSFEFGRLITGDKRRFSLCYALLLTLSPFVQWWFSINSLVEMLIASQFSILSLNSYLKAESFWKKTGLAAIIVLCGGAFILAFYPSWMVPLIYLILIFIVWTFVSRRKEIHFTLKDGIAIVVLILIAGALLGHAFYKSKDFFRLMTQTVYPGARYMNGGEGHELLFRYIESLWYPIEGVISEYRYVTCDSVMVITFSPLPYILAVYVFFKGKKKDLLSIMLFAVCLFFLYFSVFGIPKFLDMILLLNYVGGNRLVPILSIFELILLFRSLSLIESPVNIKGNVLLTVITVAFVFVYNYLIYFRFPSLLLYLVTALIFAGMIFLIVHAVRRKKASRWLVSAVILLTFISGGLVNPIRKGITDITDNAVVSSVRNVYNNENGLFAVISDYPRINIPLVSGVPGINTTNIYPNLDLWRKLDEDHEFEDVYNRYAHISLKLKDSGKAEFSLLAPDYINIELTLDTLRDLGVKYLLIQDDSIDFMDEKSILLDSQMGYYIYKISDNE